MWGKKKQQQKKHITMSWLKFCCNIIIHAGFIIKIYD